jgi:hypothetical protein
LLQPFRDLGIPEPLLAAVEPALKVIVDAGYDRTINPGVPTPARLLPPIDLVKLTDDLIDAAGKGVQDAIDEIEHPTPKPPGPTPTERVLTDLINTNVTHTLNRLGLGSSGAATRPTNRAADKAAASPNKTPGSTATAGKKSAAHAKSTGPRRPSNDD